MPPGRKSEYLLTGRVRESSVAGYQISVTNVRGSRVKASVRLESTKTVVVTPTAYGPSSLEGDAAEQENPQPAISSQPRLTLVTRACCKSPRSAGRPGPQRVRLRPRVGTLLGA